MENQEKEWFLDRDNAQIFKLCKEFEGTYGDLSFTIMAEWNPGDNDWFVEDVHFQNGEDVSNEIISEITEKFYEEMN